MIPYNLEYIKGCFCFADKSYYSEGQNQISERFSRIIFKYMYESKLEVTDIKDLISVIHELYHLTQDLSFTSCRVERNLKDRISILSSRRKDLFGGFQPLILKKDGNKINPYYYNQNYIDTYATYLYFLIDLSKVYFHNKVTVPDSARNFCALFGIDKDISISYNDLLESSAHFHSLKAIIVKTCLNGVSISNFSTSSYFPLHISEDGHVSVDRRQFLYNGRYFNPFILFFIATLNSIWWGDIVNYFNTCFPCNSDIDYRVNTEVIRFLTFYKMVIEVALTLPSELYVYLSGKDYNPVHRYFYILNYVNNLSREQVNSYANGRLEVFFNDCAREYGWLSYDETYETFDISGDDGSIYDITVKDFYKYRKSVDYCKLDTFIMIAKLPLLFRNEKIFKVSYIDNRIFFADCPYRDLDDAYFRQYRNYENDELDIQGMINLQGIILRNVAYRLCKNTYSEYIINGKENISCPLMQIECPLRNDGCNDIRDLDIFKSYMSNICKNLDRSQTTCVFLSSIESASL